MSIQELFVQNKSTSYDFGHVDVYAKDIHAKNLSGTLVSSKIIVDEYRDIVLKSNDGNNFQPNSGYVLMRSPIYQYNNVPNNTTTSLLSPGTIQFSPYIYKNQFEGSCTIKFELICEVHNLTGFAALQMNFWLDGVSYIYTPPISIGSAIYNVKSNATFSISSYDAINQKINFSICIENKIQNQGNIDPPVFTTSILYFNDIAVNNDKLLYNYTMTNTLNSLLFIRRHVMDVVQCS